VPAIFPGRPAEEHVARRLHQALPGNDALAVIGMQALARIGFEHRRPRFLDLQEEGVIVGGHEQPDGAPGADAADADDLGRQVA
jgi:hypothetical protein